MNYYPPPNPWWGYGGPPQKNKNKGGRQSFQKEVDRAVSRRLNEINRPKVEKRKRREERSKKAAASRARFFTALEVFILGVVAQPFVGMLYHYLQSKYGLP